MSPQLYIFYNHTTDEVAMFNCKKTKTALKKLRRVLKHKKLKGKFEDFECSLYDEGLDMLGCYR